MNSELKHIRLALEQAAEKGDHLHIGIVIGQTIARLKDLESTPDLLSLLDEVYVVGDEEMTYYKLAHKIQELNK